MALIRSFSVMAILLAKPFITLGVVLQLINSKPATSAGQQKKALGRAGRVLAIGRVAMGVATAGLSPVC